VNGYRLNALARGNLSIGAVRSFWMLVGVHDLAHDVGGVIISSLALLAHDPEVQLPHRYEAFMKVSLA
jgi:hypothetical protein